MKHLTRALSVLLLVFLGCSRDLPTETEVGNTALNVNEQASMTKKGHRDLLKVYRTRKAPKIDGKQDKPWRKAPKITIRNDIDGLLELTSPDGPRDLSAYFQLLWDDDNLYLFVKVKDDELNVSSPNDWENDGIQIYFDGDNSKNVLPDCPSDLHDWPLPGAYDSNDYQLTAAFGHDHHSYPTPIDVSALDFAYRQHYKGYTIEAALPFNTLLFPAEQGHRFGFEMQVIDNDTGVRQHVLIWTRDEGECFWLNPSSWGTAILVDKRSHDDDDDDDDDEEKDDDEVTICHKPGTPAQKSLVIPKHALNSHLRHGDTIGACEPDECVATTATEYIISGTSAPDAGIFVDDILRVYVNDVMGAEISQGGGCCPPADPIRFVANTGDVLRVQAQDANQCYSLQGLWLQKANGSCLTQLSGEIFGPNCDSEPPEQIFFDQTFTLP